ncbi:MAG: sigma-70 family RNA polymerase sigma factor [Deltaproteobacteria bacterium]|nr:sigma-70 family RNA polymerase sigma factor [Deltaproteobacteria bacterium]
MLSLSTFMSLPFGDSRVRQVPLALEQDSGALRTLIGSVVSCILGVPRDHPDVEDCTHEVLRRAIEGQDKLRSTDALRPWVLGIARHVALDAIRDRKRARRHDGSDDSGLEALPDRELALDDQVARAEQQQRLRAVMDTLPKGQRDALLLFHGEGRGYQEIAARLGVPLGTVATWITRGRQAMAAALGDVRNHETA